MPISPHNSFQKDLAGLKSFQAPQAVTNSYVSGEFSMEPLRFQQSPSVSDASQQLRSLVNESSNSRIAMTSSISFSGHPVSRVNNVPTRAQLQQQQHADPSSDLAKSPSGGTARKHRSVSPIAGSATTGGKRSLSRGPSPVLRVTPAQSNAVVRKVPSSRTMATATNNSGPSKSTRKNPSELELSKHEIEVLRGKLQEAQERMTEDAALIQSMEQERCELDTQLNATQEQIKTMESCLQAQEQELSKTVMDRDALRQDVMKRDHSIQDLHAQLSHAKEKEELVVKNANERIAAITDAANERMSAFEKHIAQMTEKEKELNQIIANQKETIGNMERAHRGKETEFYSILREGEIMRSDLHNRIQEMKGNIRVYARIRPLIPHDKEYRTKPTIENYDFPDRVDHRQLKVAIPSIGKDYSFEFDKVFDPETTQNRVFEEISQLVQSALDGYKVCIFVYGQTGSGKTYTMEGGPADAAGMIPRAVEHIFRNSQAKKAHGWEYTLRATFVEIYNETIHDLLNPQDFKGPNAVKAEKHEIRVIDNDTIITNVEEVLVEDANTVHKLIEISQANRRCETTLMNDRASRSHSVFTLKIRGVNEGTAQVQEGVLNLIDLAGSERVGKSGVEGDRFRETAYINKSLTCLGDVISALAKGDSHIPFRNSKLTYMLQPYMGGESKTLMFVNISPAESHINESLCSLRFAAKVNACEIGLALRRVQSVSNISQKK